MGSDHQAVSSDLAGTLRALRRRWWLVPMCWVIVVASAAVFSLTAQKEYSADAGLLFRDPGFDQKLFGTTFLAPSRDPAREAATNVKLVSLDIVAQRTARFFPGLTARAVSDKIKAAPEGQSDVVSVTATDHDPVRARRLANAFAQQYIAFRRDSDRAKIREAQALVQQRISTLTPQQRVNPEGRSLSERADQLQVLASLQTGNAELVQLALTPTAPSSPKVTRNLILAAVLGLLLGVGATLLVHRLDRRLREPDEIEEAFGLPVIGAIPRSAAFARGKALIVPDEIDIAHGEAEAFRLLRARMRYFNVDREVRTVLIVSAVPADGKTTVAVHLAAAAASSGAKAVLLEADLRRPTVSQRVGSAPSVGLAEVLTHGAQLSDVVREISIRTGSADPAADHASFDLITAGFPPPNPHELIESKRMAELLEELSSDYDLVVIDTPPLLSVSDAIPLIGRVDGVLIVSRLGATTSDAARRLASELKGLNAPVLGIVANGLRSRAQAYYYGYEPDRSLTHA
jgi:succinoglycan biosynthesis transport protein ExoP